MLASGFALGWLGVKSWSRFHPNSKHWFTTSFLQPLPYLVTPQGPENCQLTSRFFVGALTVVSLLQSTRNKPTRVVYSRQQSLHQHKQNHNRLNRDGTSSFFSFLPGVHASRVYVRAWALGCFNSHISTRTFRRALTASVDSCAEIKIECSFCCTFCH